MQKKDKTKGFTLIELLVVVLIIGILAAVALPQYQRAVDKSRFAGLMNIAKSLASANERYYLARDSYATNFNDLDIDIPANSISGSTAYFDWGTCTLLAQQQVQCLNNTNLQNKFIVHYHFGTHSSYRNKILCAAITTEENSRFDKLCQSVGHFLSTDSCTEGPCRIYQLR